MRRLYVFTALLLLVILSAYRAPEGYGEGELSGLWQQAKSNMGELEGVILGAGVRYATSPYIDVDEDALPIPIIVAEYGPFYIDGAKAGFLLNKDERVRCSAVLAPRWQGYEEDDSPVLSGMEDREWSLDGGINIAWENEFAVVGLTFLTDLSSNHQGQEVRAMVSQEFMQGFLTPRLGLSWQSAGLVDYYYGVTGNEATPTRPVYQPDGSFNYFIGARIAYPLGGHWALLGDVAVEFYGSEIRDSPIVDADEQVTYLLGAVYRF